MATRLPSIDMLLAFDSVMTHGGFARAADALHLSPAAVSYQVRAFERALGAPLFRRRPDGVTPLPRASALVEEVRDLIERLRRLPEHGNDRPATIRILAAQAFASLWLLPRMPKLIEAFPDRRFDVVSWTGGPDWANAAGGHDIDIEVKWTNDRERDGDHVLLAKDSAVVICSPDYLRAHGPVLDRSSCARITVIHAIIWPAIWSQWCRAAFGAQVVVGGEIHLQHTAMCIQAALSGLGIAVAHRPLAANDLAEGRLVLAHPYELDVPECYVAVRHNGRLPQDVFGAVTDWLRMNMGG